MDHCTPEKAGISSRDVLNFYRALDKKHLSTHSVIMARGDCIFTECNYRPFTPEFKHRMYSVSKTFVSMAIGFCRQDGLLSLDDRFGAFFPEYDGDERLMNATLRDMLLMRTPFESGIDWFYSGASDRNDVYFAKHSDCYAGTHFQYDSPAAYMLGVIVERLTGKPFMEYLKEKVLTDIGFSSDAYCLKVPGGHSFSDSGVMCTPRDLLLFARFVQNGGTFGGRRYLDEEYIAEATEMRPNGDYGFEAHDTHGYGYFIWGAPEGCFAMLGMGNQIALCDKKHDFTFVMTSDNQGNPHNYEQIFDALYSNIIDKLGDSTLPADKTAQYELSAYISSAKLFCLPGAVSSPFVGRISGKEFVCDENVMKISRFSLTFSDNTGRFDYTDAYGRKEFVFGFGHNEFGKFPQDDMPDMTATLPCPGNRYDAAFSADWQSERQLRVRVQIIDKYFGNLAIVFGFTDENHVSVVMTKTAEAFLDEYRGVMNAKANNITDIRTESARNAT
ncbi:MAG: beta-lactamase family protein [Clostridia bacterium]|nr:beta-lactamase family protein [Clostridia bacterium]